MRRVSASLLRVALVLVSAAALYAPASAQVQEAGVVGRQFGSSLFVAVITGVGEGDMDFSLALIRNGVKAVIQPDSVDLTTDNGGLVKNWMVKKFGKVVFANDTLEAEVFATNLAAPDSSVVDQAHCILLGRRDAFCY